jgi:hypothetical protein
MSEKFVTLSFTFGFMWMRTIMKECESNMQAAMVCFTALFTRT